MYSKGDDEYFQAIKDAQVNSYLEKREKGGMLFFINMLLFLALVVIVFLYFTQDKNYLSENIFGKKTAVLGATHSSTDSDYSDEELMSMLNSSEVDNIGDGSVSSTQQATELVNELNHVVDEIVISEKSKYTSAISKELEDKGKGVKGRVVVVKKGDTLSSLAKKYYGNSMAFHKIIEHNKEITDNSLYVGQKINIPY